MGRLEHPHPSLAPFRAAVCVRKKSRVRRRERCPMSPLPRLRDMRHALVRLYPPRDKTQDTYQRGSSLTRLQTDSKQLRVSECKDRTRTHSHCLRPCSRAYLFVCKPAWSQHMHMHPSPAAQQHSQPSRQFEKNWTCCV
jgi:hypothetical protein